MKVLPEQLENALRALEEAGFAPPPQEGSAQGRVYGVLTDFLLKASAEDLLRFAPLLAQAIPELAPTLGFQQHSPHHAYDVFTHTAYVTGAVPAVAALRWAALLHDIGKVPCFTQDENGRGHFKGHAQVSARMASAVLERLNAPEEVRQRAVWLIDHHMTVLPPDEKLLSSILSRYGRENLEQLLLLQEADMKGKGTKEHENSLRYPKIREILNRLEPPRTQK